MPTSPSNIEGGGQGAVHECIMEMGVYLSRTGTAHQTLRTNKRETDVAKIRACIDLTRYRGARGVRTREGKEHGTSLKDQREALAAELPPSGGVTRLRRSA